MQEILENCKELEETAKMSLQKYERGKIYKIHPADSEAPCYIGSSTCKYLAARLRQHRGHYKMWQNKKFTYISSFDVLEKGNWWAQTMSFIRSRFEFPFAVQKKQCLLGNYESRVDLVRLSD